MRSTWRNGTLTIRRDAWLDIAAEVGEDGIRLSHARILFTVLDYKRQGEVLLLHLLTICVLRESAPMTADVFIGEIYDII
eukprot:6580327-Prorocentrum_lima.AAC.1